MEKENCFYLGKITRTVGFKGEVVLFIDADNPESYSDLKSVFIDLAGNLVPFFVEYTGSLQKGNQLKIKFLDINSQEQSSQLQNCEIYLPLEFLPPLKGNNFYFHEIAGFCAIDKEFGNIGIIRQILDYPGNPLFDIRFGDKELLIPVRDEFIEKVDRENKTIFLNSPQGLIEIYLDDNQRDDN